MCRSVFPSNLKENESAFDVFVHFATVFNKSVTSNFVVERFKCFIYLVVDFYQVHRHLVAGGRSVVLRTHVFGFDVVEALVWRFITTADKW